MTRNEVIELARQSGFEILVSYDGKKKKEAVGAITFDEDGTAGLCEFTAELEGFAKRLEAKIKGAK